MSNAEPWDYSSPALDPDLAQTYEEEATDIRLPLLPSQFIETSVPIRGA